ncbi:MAG: adenosylcobinamide-GDP ribazoletransferase, partial [Candidatus Thermoplasmatota archaeon]
VVACIIGFVSYLVSCVAFSFFTPEIGAIVTVIALYTITGLMHLDALSDFADGVMAKGERTKKITAMKDVNTGIAGIFSILIILILTFYSVKLLGASTGSKIIFGYEIPRYRLGSALIVSELSAKLSMNTCILLGRKIHHGIGAIFIEHSSIAKYCIATALAIGIGFLLVNLYFVVVLVGVTVGVIVVGIANKNFGGVSGDVVGASNELARIATLLIFTVTL